MSSTPVLSTILLVVMRLTLWSKVQLHDRCLTAMAIVFLSYAVTIAQRNAVRLNVNVPWQNASALTNCFIMARLLLSTVAIISPLARYDLLVNARR